MKNTGKYMVTICLICLLVFGLTSCKSDEKSLLYGKWQGTVSVTDEVLKNAYGWLDTEYTDVSDCFGEYEIITYITFEENGTYRCSLDADSYDAAFNQARKSFKTAFMNIAVKAIEGEGKTGDDASIEKAVSDSLNMTLDEYLEEYGPELMPSYEKMCENLEITGQYGIKDGFLFISDGADVSFEDGAECVYSCSEDVLSFGEAPDVHAYTKIKEADN